MVLLEEGPFKQKQVLISWNMMPQLAYDFLRLTNVQKRSSYIIGSLMGRSTRAVTIRDWNIPGLIYNLIHVGLEGSR